MVRKFLLLLIFSGIISAGKIQSQCAILGAKTVTLISGSGSGTSINPYTAGSVISVCITVDSVFEANTNWLHGVYLIGVPAGSIVNPGTPVPGSVWIWDASGCNGRPKGWYFDEDADGDPCNNFGDDPCGDDPAGPCGRQFCFNITLPITPGNSQLMVKTTGDGTTGSWTDAGCDDPAVNVGSQIFFGATVSCPTLTIAPNVTITNNSCGLGCAPIRTGTINISNAGCPSGSTLRWFTSASTTTGGVTTTPTYAAGQSYHARCVCDADNSIISPVTTITAAAQCPPDNTGPTISCPSNATISGCFATQADAVNALPAPDTSLVTASDLNGPVVKTHVGDANPINTNGCQYIVQRTYRATDICNNFSECNQIFTVYFGCIFNNSCMSTSNSRCVAPFNGSALVSTDMTNPTYLWSNGASTSTVTGLAGGTYTVTITDGISGCTNTCSSVVANATSTPTVTCSATPNTNCVNSNGTASANASGVSYFWNTGAITSTVANLSAGTYTVTVTDNTTGCTSTCEAVVGSSASSPTVSCSSTDNTNCTTPNGTATATATNVSYLWSNGETSASISGLSAGVYTVTVTDLSTGCTATCASTVSDNTSNPAVSCSSTDNSSCINANGTASATATNVSYLWSNGETSASISGLSAGVYTVTVTDLSTGCTATCTSNVASNTSNPLVTCSATDNTNCSGAGNGTAAATASGVSYQWSGGETTSSISGLSAGTYTVTVTDNTTGCTSTCEAVVGSSASSPTVSCSSTDNTNCTAPNGTATATATNVSYLWSNGETSANISGLSAGVYTVTVTDLSTGCTATCASTVSDNTSNPAVSCSSTDNSSCTNANGTASATATNVSYLWSNGETSASISGLSAGVYTVTVTDLSTGCTATCTSNVAINTSNPLVTCSATDNTNCSGAGNGTAAATASGVSYQWSGGETTSSISGLSAGTYTVTVTDNTTGCTSTCEAVVGSSASSPTVSCSSTDNTNCTTPNGTATATATNVSYLWSNGETSASISGLSAGVYTVTVTDLSTGCTATCTSNVASNTSNPLVTCSATNNTNCSGAGNGTAAATASGVSYQWSGGETTSSISGLSAGTYTVTVTDNTTGCTSTCEAVVGSSASSPTVSCSSTDNTNCCPPGTTATATNVSYLWSNGETSASISGLSAGVYTVTNGYTEHRMHRNMHKQCCK
ncbi:MAG: hypothetical protein IPO27_16625 [Bacteroidetes bacterium]|nr:hypothetical protein [Bacteroidota bacterium]